METQTIVIKNSTGMHARPAKIFVNAAKQFKSDIRVVKEEKKANAKSLVSLLTLGIQSGQEISVIAEGIDENKAITELIALVNSGLGEDLPEAAEPAKQEPSVPERVTDRIQPILSESCEKSIQGISAAPGIAIGPVYKFLRRKIVIEETFAGSSVETTRLQEAVEEARGQLESLRRQMTEHAPEEAAIFDVHLELLEDPELIEAVLQKLEEEQSAAQAWQSVIEAKANSLKELSDPLLAARAADLHDVSYRVLRILMGISETNIHLPDHPVILIAADLTPSDTASLDTSKVLGFCTSTGGPTAHSAIIARAMGIPAVVGAGSDVLEITNGIQVILDGDNGVLNVAPDQKALKHAEALFKQYQQQQEFAEKTATNPAITKDGHIMEIVANIGGLEDAKNAVEHGAEGVGLLRTEFLFLDRASAPTEQEQFEVYRDIVTAMEGRPVIIRTLDIGGDKPLPYLDLPAENNPFLGERGIRLCLNRPELLNQQLRAILRASSYGQIRIMFPMISDISEWKKAREMVTQLSKELKVEKIECGIMIEVPSAALMADVFATEIDFFSVGTNDLTQYTMAIDRMHPTLSKSSDGLHPAVLRLIERTVKAAHANGKWVGVCGELGSDTKAIPILVGLGVDELSVSVPMVGRVKSTVRSFKQSDAIGLAQKAVACATASEVRTLSINNETNPLENTNTEEEMNDTSSYSKYRLAEKPKNEKTWTWNMYGAGVENIGNNDQPEAIEIPEPNADQLLVRVDAVGLCFSDVKLIMQGGNHPKLYNRDLSVEPTRLGHEAALTVVKVGEHLQNQFEKGQQYAMQPDIYQDGKSTAYGYTVPGGLIQYHLIGPEVLKTDAGSCLLKTSGDLGLAETALLEPWGCVWASYTQRRRLDPKPGGIMWIVGEKSDQQQYQFSAGLDQPGTIVLTDVPDQLSKLVEQTTAKIIVRDQLTPENYESLVTELTDGKGFDDIVLLAPRSSAKTSAIAKHIARRGTMNMVGKDALDGMVEADVGRLHYDYIAFIGNPGPDIAASYGQQRNRCELRPNGVAVFVGAGGPMGQMHVQRAIELPDGPRLIIISDINEDRLSEIRARFSPLAATNNRELLIFNPQKANESFIDFVQKANNQQGADDVVVCVPNAKVMAEAATLMNQDGMLVFFAGVPNGTMAPLDLSIVYQNNAQYTGTSGLTMDDQIQVMSSALEGSLSPAHSVAAIGGMKAAKEGLKAMMDGRYPGKILIFPQLLDLPLMGLNELKEKMPEVGNQLAPGNIWTKAAEQALIELCWKEI